MIHVFIGSASDANHRSHCITPCGVAVGCFVVVAWLMAAGSAYAQLIEWTAPVGGSWSSDESWSSGTMIPNSDSVHVLFGDAVIQPSTISVDVDVTVGNITFDNGTYSYLVEGYSGHFLTLAGDAVVDVVSSTHTLRDLAGTDGLVKTGPGTLIFNGTNTYSGTTSVNQGTLQMVDENSLGDSDVIVVNAGATILSGDTYIGRAPGSDVTATVDGVGANWTASGSFYVGDQGIGALNIQNGGVVSNAFGAVGFDSGSEGSVTVSGVGTLWNCSNDLHIGSSGTGWVTLAVGAQLQVDGEILVNRYAAGDGLLFVTGSGTTAEANGELRVAGEGLGFLRIEDGAVVTSASGSLARDSGAIGSAWVDGLGTAWNIAGDLSVGVQGEGELRIRNDGAVSVGGGAGIVNLGVEAGSQGRILIGAGSSDTAGTLLASEVNGGLGLANINFHHAESNYTFAPVLSGTLSLYHLNSGTTILTGSNTYTGTTNVSAGTLIVNGTHTSGGDYTVNAGGTLGGSGTINAPVTVYGTLAPGNSPGIITIDGDYMQDADGTLEIEVAGVTTPGTDFDQLQVTGTATLAGRLDVPIINGFVPQEDDEITFLTAGLGVTGEFSALSAPGLAGANPNVAVELDYGGNNVVARFVAVSNEIQLDYPVTATVDWSDTNTWTDGMIDTVPDSTNVISVQNLVGGTPQRIEVESENAFVHRLTVGGAGAELAATITVAVETGQTLSATTSVEVFGGTEGPGVIELADGRLVSPTVTIGVGAQLSGNGRVVGDVVFDGTISPGFSVGQIEVAGNLQQGANGMMVIELEGTSPGEGDTISVSGAAQLGGTLRIDASNLAGTDPGDVFEIISAGSLSGAFASVESVGNNNIYFEEIYNYAGGGLSVMQLNRGDMNGDTIINSADYDLFVFGLMNASSSRFFAQCNCDIFPQEGGDFSGNGRLDFEDIAGFQNQLGGMGMSDAGLASAFDRYFSNVPEPSSGFLIVLGGVLLLPIGRRNGSARRRH